MKKVLIAMGMMLAATFTLTNCAQDELLAPDGAKGLKTSKILVSNELTRTTNDGLATLWAAGDEAHVLHAVAGAEEYVNDGKWTAEATGATSNFSGNVNAEIDPAASYDWYMFYPNFNFTTPKGTGINVAVGGRVEQQAEMNSRAHIVGKTFPLCGRALNVLGSAIPEIRMANATTAIEVKVTNTSASNIRIFTVEFFAPDGTALTGNFNVDFSGAAPQLTSVAASPDNGVRVNVAGGQVLLPNSSATFYAAFAPFKAAAGQTVALRVNGYEKTVTFSADTDFAAGHIRTLDFNYDLAEPDYSGDVFLVGYPADGSAWAAVNIEAAPAAYDGSTGANPILMQHKVRIDGSQVYYDPDMSIVGASATLDATIDDYKFKVTKVADGTFAGMYTIQRPSDSKYLGVDYVISGNSLGYYDVPNSDCYFDICKNGAADGFHIVSTVGSGTRRRFTFNYNNGNIPRLVFVGEGNTNGFIDIVPFGEPKIDPMPRFVPISDISILAKGAVDESFDVLIENNDENGWYLAVESFTGCVTAAETGFGDSITYSTLANTDTENSLTGTIVLALVDPNDENHKVTTTVNVSVAKKPTKFYKKVTTLPVVAGTTKETAPEYLLVCEELSIIFKTSAQGGALTAPGNYLNVVIEEDGIAPSDAIDASTVRIAENQDGADWVSVWCRGVEGNYWWQNVGIHAAKETASMNFNTDGRFHISMTMDDAKNIELTCTARNVTPNWTGVLTVNSEKGDSPEFRFNSANDMETYVCYPVQLYQLQ